MKVSKQMRDTRKRRKEKREKAKRKMERGQKEHQKEMGQKQVEFNKHRKAALKTAGRIASLYFEMVSHYGDATYLSILTHKAESHGDHLKQEMLNMKEIANEIFGQK